MAHFGQNRCHTPDSLPRLANGQTIAWGISRRDLKLWLAEAYPVILVVYDGMALTEPEVSAGLVFMANPGVRMRDH